jgi:ABC-type Zn2+ transport system substrate-binding protein/surface adhesin
VKRLEAERDATLAAIAEAEKLVRATDSAILSVEGMPGYRDRDRKDYHKRLTTGDGQFAAGLFDLRQRAHRLAQQGAELGEKIREWKSWLTRAEEEAADDGTIHDGLVRARAKDASRELPKLKELAERLSAQRESLKKQIADIDKKAWAIVAARYGDPE